MKGKTTLILVLVAVVIGGLVALDHFKGTPTDERAEKRKQLVAIERAEITHVELVRTNETIVLDKVDNDWQLKTPVAYPADHSAVSGMLDELQFARRTRTLSASETAHLNRDDMGLNPPRLSLTVAGKKTPVTLRVGSQTPAGNAVYVEVAGQPGIALTDRSFADRLDRNLNDLRDRTVIDATAATATRLELKSAGLVVELAKSAATTNAEPQWTLVQPLTARADQTAVSDLLGDLNGLRVVAFVSDDPKDLRTYQLDEPTREISVWKGASDLGRTLLLGQAATNDPAHVYAKLKGRDTIFTLPADKVNELKLAVNELRDPVVMTLEPDAVHALEIQRGTERLAVERADPGWKLTVPVQRPADPDAVADLLFDLESLEAQQFVADVPTDLEPYGLTVPAVIVTLKGAATNTLAQLLLGTVNASNGVQYAKLASEPFVYGVDTNLTEWLPAAPQPLFARRLAEIQPAQITRLVLEHPDRKIILERDADLNWKLVEPVTGVLDADAVRAVVDAVAELRAEEFLPNTPTQSAACRLEKPVLTVTATTADKNYVLKIGAPDEAGTHCAGWNDPESIFKIADPTFQTLTKNPLPSATPPAPAATEPTPPPAAE